MKLYSKMAIGLASLAIVAGLVVVPSVTNAQTTTIQTQPYTSLGDLFVLDQLFYPGMGFNNYGYGGISNLGDLFVLNRLFNPNGFGLGY